MKNGSSWTMIIGGLVAGLVIGYFLGSSVKGSQTETAMTAKAQTVEVKFGNHIQMNLPEQDVFIEKDNQLWRVEGAAGKDPKNLEAKVYAASRAIDHDPFKTGKNPLGPFPKGNELGFTLGQWLDATGNGTYTIDGDKAELNLTFSKLIANGTYTLWCSRLTFPPKVAIVDRPCGNADGSENVFKSDKDGNAAVNLKLNKLEDSSKETATVLAVAFHSDGKTYGANPGDFGLNSHVQLAFLLPVVAAEVKTSGDKPSEGFTLHIDAKKHFPGKPEMIAHHYCKGVADGLTECQLYDSDAKDARLVGVEVIVGPDMYKSFNAAEKTQWHYHKDEIPKVDAKLPDLSEEEAVKVVKSIEDTYGKIYLLWDPGKGDQPVGNPIVNILP